MQIKICGITSLDEIYILNRQKPDFAGFVFAESKRKVSIDTAKRLIDSLDKNIKTVAVFRNNSKEYIHEVLSKINFDVIQLHGSETKDFIEELTKAYSSAIWKAFSIECKKDIDIINSYPVSTIILDGSDPGSGKTFNWNNIKNNQISKNIIIAGGINQDNVLDAIDIFNPIGIDVSSGVETIDSNNNRIKDENKIHILINKVRDNDERKI